MKRRDQGFTLIELVVALAIFAVLSALVYGGLRTVLDARSHTDRQATRLAQLQTMFTLMERDVEQAVARRARDELGGFLPAMRATVSRDGGTLEFSREGWRNPAGRPRGNIQRVAYLVRDGKLLRQSWAMLDRAPGVRPQEAVLLEGIKGVEMRFLDPQMRWQLQWPPATTDGSSQIMLPRAVEVSLDIEGWGRLPRIFRVAGTPAVPAAQTGVIQSGTTQSGAGQSTASQQTGVAR